MPETKKKSNGDARPVLVTTANRGVFFGYADDTKSAPASLKLKRARCCVWWQDTKGFLGLAEAGPNARCKIGPAAEAVELFNITSIADVTPKAVDAWESAPWSR